MGVRKRGSRRGVSRVERGIEERRLRERGVLLEEGVGAAGERAKRAICAARSTKKHGGR